MTDQKIEKCTLWFMWLFLLIVGLGGITCLYVMGIIDALANHKDAVLSICCISAVYAVLMWGIGDNVVRNPPWKARKTRLTEKLLDQRRHWQLQEYYDAYHEEWPSIPVYEHECLKMMKESIAKLTENEIEDLIHE